MEPLRIGIIGAGRIGVVHAKAIATLVEQGKLTSIADIDAQAARSLAEKWGVPRAYDDYRMILGDPEIDAVAICSSTDTHAQIITEAAEAGKHIFCEKPIDHDLHKIDSALAAVEAAGVKLMIGFQRRFDPNFRRVKELVSAGAIGDPHILKITSRDPAPPPVEYIRVSGGIFLDMTIHDFDVARFLMDSEVTQVFAAGGVMVDPAIGDAGDIDTAAITLWFENGGIALIDNSRQAAYGYDQRVEIFGSKGMAQAENDTQDRHILSTSSGISTSKPLHFFLERYLEAYAQEIEAFVKCIREDSESPVSGTDGRAPVVIGIAARRSYLENRPVQISEIRSDE